MAELVFFPAGGKFDRDFLIGDFDFEINEAVEHVLELVRVAFREKQHEFVAAEARGQVGAANRAGNVFGEGAQHRVARRMAVAVVDLLEAVEIEQKQGERGSLSLAAIDFGFHARFRKAAVVEASERVEHGHAV